MHQIVSFFCSCDITFNEAEERSCNRTMNVGLNSQKHKDNTPMGVVVVRVPFVKG